MVQQPSHRCQEACPWLFCLARWVTIDGRYRFGSDLDIGDTKRHPLRNPLRRGYGGVAAPTLDAASPPPEVDAVIVKEWCDEPRAGSTGHYEGVRTRQCVVGRQF